MRQRKKNQNKQNFKTIKKTTLQQINYTQQLHIPTYATMQLRQAAPSIELKKSSSKKPGSRKSRCISAKQSGPQVPLNIKQLLKQFKSMKLIQSRSRSPHTNKSKQKGRKSTKRLTHTQVNSKSNSQLNLTAKVQRTLQKLKQASYFKDQQQSEIPLISTSQAFTQQQKKRLQYIVSGENFEDINIHELRLFCKNTQPSIRMNLQYFKGNIYEIMARRIQRAWRRYRTHQLVKRYTNIALRFNSQFQQSPSDSRIISQRLNKAERVQFSSQQLYPQQFVQRKVTYISNLQQESDEHFEKQKQLEESIQNQHEHSNSKQEQQDPKLYEIKKQQLQKWEQIVTIIKSNKNQNPQQTQKLLKTLISKSELNKRSLQIVPVNHQDSSNEQRIDEQSNEQHNQQQQGYSSRQQQEEDYQLHNQRRTDEQMQQMIRKSEEIFRKQNQRKKAQQISSVSQDSLKQNQQQFNCKKYIQYLDSDMYPIAPHHKQSFTTIGKKKQQALLNKLQGQNSAKRFIRGSKILGSGNPSQFEIQGEAKSRLSYRSNSQISQNGGIDAQQLKTSSRGSGRRQLKLLNLQIKKSISQKAIKYNATSYELNQLNNATIVVKEQKNKKQSIEDKQFDNLIVTFKQQIDKQPTSKEESKKPYIFQRIRNGVEQDMRLLMKKQLEQFDDDAQKFLSQLSRPCPQQRSTQKVFLQQQLMRQMAQLHKMRQQDSDQQVPPKPQAQFQPILHRSNNNIIEKVSIQKYERSIQSSDQQNSQADLAQKSEQVTEMIVNNLNIQILVEMARYPDTILKRFKQMSSSKKSKVKKAPAKPKKNGFATNQAEIKNFIEELCDYVLNQQPQIFKNLEKATGPSALQMLRYMHQSVDQDIYMDEEQDDPSVMILPNWIFQNYWSKKVLTIKYQKQSLQQDREKQRQQYLKGLNKIFLRSCFDCLNECLDYERNFGPFGKPFPWKRSHYFQHIKQLQQTKKSVTNAQKRLFQTSSTYCGIIIQKQQIMSLCGNQQYVAQVQQDRLSRMLAQDLVEGEERWIFYDDEQTQLLVEASNIIYYQLIQQITGILYGRKPYHNFF